MSTFDPGVTFTLCDALYAPNAITIPPTISRTPSTCSAYSTLARPVFTLIAAISSLNCSARSLDSFIVFSPTEIGIRQLAFYCLRAVELHNPAAKHDPDPVRDAEH